MTSDNKIVQPLKYFVFYLYFSFNLIKSLYLKHINIESIPNVNRILILGFRIAENSSPYVSKESRRIICNPEEEKHRNLRTKIQINVQSSPTKDKAICMEYDKCGNFGKLFITGVLKGSLFLFS